MSKKKMNIKEILIQYNAYIIFVALFVICAILSDRFLSLMNIRNIALQQAGPICVVLGMDLSVGSVMALGSSLAAYLIVFKNVPFQLAIVIAMVMGLAAGTVTGTLVAYAKFQGFVASLAMMTIARGAALVITNGSPIKMEGDTLSLIVKKEYGYPILIITFAIIVIFCIIQRNTAYGRIVIALGSNIEAVELAGIRVKKYLVSVYAISGMLAALGGVFIAARASTGSGVISEGQELDAIAACVIGGASLAGGKGDVFRAIIGAFILALISNIMNLMAVPAYPQDIIKGIIIIIAVLLQLVTDRKE